MSRLVLPLEKMPEQYFQTADQLPTIPSPHALQLFDQVLDIDFLETTLLEQLGSLLSPGMNIALV